MPIEIKAYQCEFCRGSRVMKSKQSIINHEARCFDNPKNRACQTCEHDNGHQMDRVTRKYMTYCAESCGDLVESQVECEYWSEKIAD